MIGKKKACIVGKSALLVTFMFRFTGIAAHDFQIRGKAERV